VQTNYAIAFSQNLLSSYPAGSPLSPSVPVAVTESGVAATAATSSVSMTDSDGVLQGTTSVALSGGQANFSNLIVPAVESSDTLTATLSLNPALAPPLNLTAGSSPFQTTAVPAELTSPTLGNQLTGSSATFTWSAGVGVTRYEFRLGTTGPGSRDVYNSGEATTTALTTGAISVPTSGGTFYARIYSIINGVAQYNDYTYTAYGTPVPAELTGPTPGNTLTGSTATFTWSAGTGVTNFADRQRTCITRLKRAQPPSPPDRSAYPQTVERSTRESTP
jgi:hypothetical protein